MSITVPTRRRVQHLTDTIDADIRRIRPIPDDAPVTIHLGVFAEHADAAAARIRATLPHATLGRDHDQWDQWGEPLGDDWTHTGDVINSRRVEHLHLDVPGVTADQTVTALLADTTLSLVAMSEGGNSHVYVSGHDDWAIEYADATRIHR